MLTNCPLGWGHEPRIGIHLLDAAVESCFWPLYEVVDGQFRLTYEPEQLLPIEEWLRPQARFAHLFRPGNAGSSGDPAARRGRLAGAAPPLRGGSPGVTAPTPLRISPNPGAGLRPDVASTASSDDLIAKTGKGGTMFTEHQPADALIEALRREHVKYELFPHRHTETALAEAEALHVDPHQVVKTLILTTPAGYVRAVLRAVDRLDLDKARAELGSEDVGLASEVDLVGAYPEFELGAVPPVGGAYDRVLVDARVFDNTFILLEAGTHGESISLRAGDLQSLADAEVADLAQETPGEPKEER